MNNNENNKDIAVNRFEDEIKDVWQNHAHIWELVEDLEGKGYAMRSMEMDQEAFCKAYLLQLIGTYIPSDPCKKELCAVLGIIPGYEPQTAGGVTDRQKLFAAENPPIAKKTVIDRAKKACNRLANKIWEDWKGHGFVLGDSFQFPGIAKKQTTDISVQDSLAGAENIFPFFSCLVHRRDLYQEIRTNFFHNNKPQLLYGFPGTGKTALAIGYALEMEKSGNYEYCFYLDISDRGSYRKGLSALGFQNEESFLDFLRNQEKCLVILDNAGDWLEKTLHFDEVASSNARVLVISDHILRETSVRVRVGSFSRDEARELYQAITGEKILQDLLYFDAISERFYNYPAAVYWIANYARSQNKTAFAMRKLLLHATMENLMAIHEVADNVSLGEKIFLGFDNLLKTLKENEQTASYINFAVYFHLSTDQIDEWKKYFPKDIDFDGIKRSFNRLKAYDWILFENDRVSMNSLCRLFFEYVRYCHRREQDYGHLRLFLKTFASAQENDDMELLYEPAEENSDFYLLILQEAASVKEFCGKQLADLMLLFGSSYHCLVSVLGKKHSHVKENTIIGQATDYYMNSAESLRKSADYAKLMYILSESSLSHNDASGAAFWKDHIPVGFDAETMFSEGGWMDYVRRNLTDTSWQEKRDLDTYRISLDLRPEIEVRTNSEAEWGTQALLDKNGKFEIKITIKNPTSKKLEFYIIVCSQDQPYDNIQSGVEISRLNVCGVERCPLDSSGNYYHIGQFSSGEEGVLIIALDLDTSLAGRNLTVQIGGIFPHPFSRKFDSLHGNKFHLKIWGGTVSTDGYSL